MTAIDRAIEANDKALAACASLICDMAAVGVDSAYPYPIKPVGYKMLVKMYETPKQVGSVIIPDSRKADEDVASMMACVLAMGPQAYDVNREQFSNGPWCDVGDIIIMKPYTGVRIKMDGSEYRLINDDSVDAVVVDVDKVGTFQRGY